MVIFILVRGGKANQLSGIDYMACQASTKEYLEGENTHLIGATSNKKFCNRGKRQTHEE